MSMKRYLIIVFLFLATVSSAQVINFAKTLPMRAFSIGAAVANNTDTYTSDGGMSYFLYGGYGIGYSFDINFKYGNFPGDDFFGADMQYLFKETRKSYFTVIGGLHWQENIWVDMTGSYTYSAQYWLNFTFGIDIDISFAGEGPRAWIPLNAGINVNEYLYIFFEYNLPANDRAWDIIALGTTLIIR